MEFDINSEHSCNVVRELWSALRFLLPLNSTYALLFPFILKVGCPAVVAYIEAANENSCHVPMLRLPTVVQTMDDDFK